LLYWKYFSFHLELSKFFPEIFYVSMVITINVAFLLDSRFMNAIFSKLKNSRQRSVAVTYAQLKQNIYRAVDHISRIGVKGDSHLHSRNSVSAVTVLLYMHFSISH
jgi:hypothetical protein